jgi:ssRNA-specific RNase YbeY (16S rRNA maturation enzyme)
MLLLTKTKTNTISKKHTLGRRPVITPVRNIPEIVIHDRQESVKINRRTLKVRGERILSVLGCPDAELQVILTDDADIAQMELDHWAPLSEDESKDVFAWSEREGRGELYNGGNLGIVTVSLQKASKQAKAWAAQGGRLGVHPWRMLDEVTYLMINGILHLIGYSAQADETPEKIHRRQRDLFALFR